MKFAFFLMILLWIPALSAGEPPRVDVAEQTLPEQQEEPRFTWGGWAALLYRDGNHADFQSYTGLPHVYLHGNYKFDSRWRLFAEVEFEEDPGLYGDYNSEFLLERAFVEYRRSAALMFRLGKFNTRAGIVKPLHWSITLDAVRQPIMESNSYVPSKSTGIEVLGTRVFPKGEWRYALSLSTSDEDLEQGEGIEEAKGAGIDLSYSGPGGYRFGGSAFYYRWPDQNEEAVRAYQPYAEYEPIPGKLLFRAESLILNRSFDEDLHAVYVKVKWDLNAKTYLNFRYDRGEDERDAEGALRISRTLTFAYRPKNYWRIKLEVGRNSFPSNNLQSFTEWSLWMGYAFP